MSVNVETLEKLERRITLAIQADTLQNEVDQRLKKLARTGSRLTASVLARCP